MMPLKRPRSVKEEGEDDLMRLQEEFLRKKQACSAEVVRNANASNDESKPSAPDPILEDAPEIADNHDIPNVFGLEIIERDVTGFNFAVGSIKGNAAPFPKATRRPATSTAGSKKSLFAQQFQKKESSKPSSAMEVESPSDESIVLDGSGLGSEGTKEAKKIHDENLKRLGEMSREEIEASRQQLMAEIDPKIIEFLKAKKTIKPSPLSKKGKESEDIEMRPAEQVVVNSEGESTPSPSSHIPVSQEEVRSNRWLNMSKVEEQKMEWMKPLPPAEGAVNHREARFNFEGTLLSNNEEISVREGLHHHGDEPERAGYTISELITFIESSLPAQKLIGLQILGKVVEKSHKGFYDLCFYDSVAKQLLEDTAVLLLIRRCLDDTSNSVISAAIACLRAIICNTDIDELYLDRMFASTFDESSVPYLVPQVSAAKLDDLKDDELVRVDPIRGLLRTDLLLRIRYLLDFNLLSQDDPLVLHNVLDILIRIARHSKSAVQAIAQCPLLVETISANFLKARLTMEASSSVFDNPFPKALKLVRVMCTYDGSFISLLSTQFPDLMRAAQLYLTIDPSSFAAEGKFSARDALQLAIESVRFWSVMLGGSDTKSRATAANHLVDLFPALIRQTQYFSSLSAVTATSITSFDWQFAATLIGMLRRLAAQEDRIAVGLSPLIQSALFVWINEIANENMLPTADVINAVAQAIIYCLSVTRSEDNLILIKNKALLPFISRGTLWKRAWAALIDCSSVIRFKADCNSGYREASNLPSFGALTFGQISNDKICCVLRETSPLPLLSAFFRVLRNIPDKATVAEALSSPPVVEYIAAASDSFVGRTFNYFEYQELLLLTSACLLAKEAVPAFSSQYLALSACVVSFIREDHLKTRLLDSVIFDRSLYRDEGCADEVLQSKLAALTLNEREWSSLAAKALEELASAQDVYKKWSDVDTTFWVFDPIINHLKVEEKEKDVDAIRRCLSWIILLKKSAPNYFARLVPSLEVEFALIVSAFLAGSDFFFDSDVALPLKACLHYFISNEKALTLPPKTKLPHVTDMSELFDQLLDQYEALSYGNALFTNYMLMFLTTSADPVFKHKLFSEERSALRMMTTRAVDITARELERLLYPAASQDLAIVEAYLKALITGSVTKERNELLYLVCVHHAHNALFSSAAHHLAQPPQTRSPLLDKLTRSVEHSSNTQLRHHLVNYGRPEDLVGALSLGVSTAAEGAPSQTSS